MAKFSVSIVNSLSLVWILSISVRRSYAFCRTNKDCDMYDEYCDTVSEICEQCSYLCDPGLDQLERCLDKCTSYYYANIAPRVIDSTQTVNVATPKPELVVHPQHQFAPMQKTASTLQENLIALGLVACAMVTLGVAVVILVYHKRKTIIEKVKIARGVSLIREETGLLNNTPPWAPVNMFGGHIQNVQASSGQTPDVQNQLCPSNHVLP